MSKIEKFGFRFEAGTHDLDIESWAALKKQPSEKGGLGTFRHFKNITKWLWPKFEWNEWAEDGVRALCENNFNAWTGCASAGKTHSAALFAVQWWALAPSITTVVLTSTTAKMVRKRIWPVIQELYHSCARVKDSACFREGLPGVLVDSKTSLHSANFSSTGRKFKDDKHGVFALAVREGSAAKALADIQGLHAPRMMIVVDEGTDTPEAILKAVTNLRKGSTEFILLIVGNPTSHLDPHGRCCQPVNGWNSINIEMESWETRGVPEWDVSPGICLHFDGTKSPNIKAGYRKFHYLISQDDLDRATRGNKGKDTAEFWKFTRGFWAPSGILRTVFTETLVEEHDGQGKHIFGSRSQMLASLDTAFGGDRCILRFGKLGDVQGSEKMGLTLGDVIEVETSSNSKHELDYQISKSVMDECKRRGVKPECFGLDATGVGRGVAAIMSREWSDSIVRVEFAGAASEKPASMDNPVPSHEVYGDRVTELWYLCREFLESNQLKGLDLEDIREFCHREYEHRGRKYWLAPKQECKLALGFSPDKADAIAIMVEVARRLGAVPYFQGAARKTQEILEVAKKAHEIYDEPEHEQFESFMPETESLNLF